MLNSIGQPFPPGASKKQLLSDLQGAGQGRRAPALARRHDLGRRPGRRQPAATPAQHRFVMFRMPNDKNMVVFGRDVRDAKSDYDPQSGPDVTMGFSGTGTKAFRHDHERARRPRAA